MMKKSQAYGSWPSQITSEWVAGAVIAFQDLVVTDTALYWSEMRPQEKGRTVIVKAPFGEEPRDILPAEFSARTRVHEYGGASFTVVDDTIYFTNDKDQCVYTLKPNEIPKKLTDPGNRFGGLQASPYGLIAIGESHEGEGDPENFIALINTQTGSIKRLVTGNDFYADIAISDDGQKIAWIAWDHPNMPWDNSQCWIGNLTENGVTNPYQIDAAHADQSFQQPQFDQHNQLFVISDKNNWWNIYAVIDKTLVPAFEVASEVGGPLWVLGQQNWTFFKDDLICTFSEDGQNKLFQVTQGVFKALPLRYSSFAQIRANDKGIAFIAGAPDKPSAICWLENDALTVSRENREMTIDAAEFSLPEHIVFQSGTGKGTGKGKGERAAYAYFYPPTNTAYTGLLGEKPPLIIKSHGGPTAAAGTDFNAEIQFWTNRGFAYVTVNYAGSTGYGRAFRQSLNGQWGIDDVEDCMACADYLIDKGLVDANRLVITGGSAGGYTVLAALTFHDKFHLGVSLYGVSDLTALAKDTHKFESHYCDSLVGPYPQDKAVYEARSPINHVDKLNAPVIFFQGADDKVVPLSQSQACYHALRAKGIPTQLFVFEGEGHGFRQAQNRQKVLEATEAFFKENLIKKT